MNAIISRGNDNLSRMMNLQKRLVSFRTQLMGSMPANRLPSEPIEKRQYDNFMDAIHGFHQTFEETILELEQEMMALENFFDQGPKAGIVSPR